MKINDYISSRIKYLTEKYGFSPAQKISQFQDAEIIFQFGKYTELLRIEKNFNLNKPGAVKNTDSKVYFTRAGGTCTWKVGKSISPKERKSALQVGNSIPLYVFDSVPGDRKLERLVHNYLEITYPGSRTVMAGNKKEWFNLDVHEMKKVIRLVKEHGEDFINHT